MPAVFHLAAVDAGTTFQGGGISWWQTLGGLLAVFGLLVVVLKLLGRLNRRHGAAEAQMLTVWPLGPKREIQVLRLGDEVHYIYRHENAMVRLKDDSFAAWEASRSGDPHVSETPSWQRFLPGGWTLPRRSGAPSDLTSF
ncbi:hypothetical protein KDM41_09925 [bacterium]|nr:hypothetical protein [bacterium]